MRNLYLLTVLFCGFIGYSQQNLQNANWYINENTAATFLPDPYNPVSITGSELTAYESCASVSNQQGELLFYTNGVTVWNSNHDIMTNGTGLYGNESNTQIAIIPRPKYPDRYYIMTLDGFSGSGRKGLHYTEVDMANGLGEIVLSKKNIPFKDHNGVLINNSYQNLSEKITSAKHSNGNDYWLVAQVNNNIYSYLITSLGPNETPSNITPSPFDLFLDNNLAQGQMKISQDAKKIGICYNDVLGGITIGEFNNSTGAITLDSNQIITLPDASIYYGVEFAPSSKIAYFNIENRIYKYDIDQESLQTLTGVVWGAGSLQLAINGKIYVYYISLNGNTYLSAINNPNSFNDPDFETHAILLQPDAEWSYGLPQWVPWHLESCQPNVELNIPETNFAPHIYEYSDYIITNNNYRIIEWQDINMIAGNYILLEPSTSIEKGSNFIAQIDECGSTQTSYGIETKNSATEETTELKTQFIVYPNPTNSSIAVRFEGTVDFYSIHDVTGKQLLTVKGNKTGETRLDLSNLAKGVYMLSANGMPIEKIIKN